MWAIVVLAVILAGLFVYSLVNPQEVPEEDPDPDRNYGAPW